jgi:hypothetical protein
VVVHDQDLDFFLPANHCRYLLYINSRLRYLAHALN